MSGHLESCAGCKTEITRQRRLSAVLFGAKPAFDRLSNEAFARRVMARVEAEAVSPWEKFASLFLVPAFGLALAALLVTLASPRVDADVPLGVAMAEDADAVLGVTP